MGILKVRSRGRLARLGRRFAKPVGVNRAGSNGKQKHIIDMLQSEFASVCDAANAGSNPAPDAIKNNNHK